MNQSQAEENGWRCPKCGTELKESRGVYYCPTCLHQKLKGIL